jgi:hypothetical protein
MKKHSENRRGLPLLVALGLACLIPVFGEGPAAPALPRAADGKPELSGIWQVLNSANYDIQDHQAQKGVPAGQGIVEGNEIPYQPWALAKKKANYEKREQLDTVPTRCFLPGVPRINYLGLPFQIFQDSKDITILYEYAHANRDIYLANAKHPKGPIEWWLGDSRGHWEGDTLVVDVVHFNDDTWFDHAGNFHSEDLHVVERYSLADRDHINYQATIEDPKVFTRPWNINVVFYRRTERNVQLLEYECYAFDLEKYYP